MVFAVRRVRALRCRSRACSDAAVVSDFKKKATDFNGETETARREVDTEVLIAGAISRGLSLYDFDNLTVGQIVDYCITYNDANSTGEEEDKAITRKANQDDWDKF